MPVEFSPAESLDERIDADRDPHYVLGARDPGMVDRALDVAGETDELFPCNVVVHQVEPGV